jgi:hypothetical protein
VRSRFEPTKNPRLIDPLFESSGPNKFVNTPSEVCVTTARRFLLSRLSFLNNNVRREYEDFKFNGRYEYEIVTVVYFAIVVSTVSKIEFVFRWNKKVLIGTESVKTFIDDS